MLFIQNSFFGGFFHKVKPWLVNFFYSKCQADGTFFCREKRPFNLEIYDLCFKKYIGPLKCPIEQTSTNFLQEKRSFL